MSTASSRFGWNLSGVAIPGLAALATIPWIVELLGAERFGLLTLCALMLTYFGVFDLGLARAVTRFASQKIGAGHVHDLPVLVATSMSLMWKLGIVGALIASAVTTLLVRFWLQVPASLRSEALFAFWITSASLPFTVVTGGWRALLESLGRFDLANKLQVPFGVLISVVPILAWHVSGSLVSVTLLLASARVISWLAHRKVARALMPDLARAAPDIGAWRGPLLTFGGWATVSNALGPLMAYLDRFLIAGVVSLAALTYYSTSYELATRAAVLGGAAIGVVFPDLSASWAVSSNKTAERYHQAMLIVLGLVLVPLAGLALFSSEILRLWLGPAFAAEGSAVLMVLAVGVLLNGLAQVSLTAIYAGGRTDWVAKLHVAELGPYLVVLWVLAEHMGIFGVAITWMLRVTFDALALAWLANRLLPVSKDRVVGFGMKLLLTILGVGFIAQADSIAIRSVTLVGILIVCAVLVIGAHRQQVGFDVT